MNELYFEGTFLSHDGVRLGSYFQGKRNGIPMILASGLGGPFESWQDLIAALPPRYFFLSWDYRGFYRSEFPPSGRLGVEENARDLLQLLLTQGLPGTLAAGWSMGVQVCLELYRIAPERVKGLILICGTYKNPFGSVSLLPEALVAGITRLFSQYPQIPRTAFKFLTSSPLALRILQSLGTISRKTQRERILTILEKMKEMDWARYFANLEELSRHSAEDLLSTIKVPVLLIAGEKDLMTPPEKAQEMASRIPGAEFLLVPGATHYAPVEEPQFIARAIDRWVERRVAA